MDLTIILPCAGTGSRLGLTIPKELYEFYPDVKLIDFSLMHIKKFISSCTNKKLKVAVVIRQSKIKVYDYVKATLPDIDVYPVDFNESYHEWAGSVYSAKNIFSKNNIVLLPDSVIQVIQKNPYYSLSGQTLIELMIQSLENNHVCFSYIDCLDKNKLKHFGAMKITEGKIIDFQDKPINNFSNYNAFWAAYGFQKKSAKNLYEFLAHSIKHEKVDYTKETFYPALGIKLYSYTDLGTWESINNFKTSFNREFFEL